MWPSSNNSTGVYTSSGQWSFNPAVYQNVPYEQVDWASLAQQWIKMKETMPSINQGPPPPPAPQISTKSSSAAVPPISTPTVIENQQNDIEGGEAPMDMDTKEEETPSGAVGVTPGGNWNQWGNWQSQWGWGWPGNAGTVPLADNTQSASSTVQSKAFWNDNFSSGSGKIEPETWIKGNKINRNQQKSVPLEQFSVMDAAKKKQLPAWIREGLNKMEREKQKKLERERMIKEKLMRDQMKSEELVEEVRNDNIQSFKMPVPNEDHAGKSSPDFNYRYQGKNYSPSAVAEPMRQRPSRNNKEDSSSIRKTKDQMMEESMLKVRRILTEILLKATENQVQVIAKEEYRRAKSSASAQQIRKSNALTSLTGNLGLDIYESETESSESDRERDDKREDSDEELKVLIEKKRRDFQRIEDLIEQEIEDKEAKERSIAQQEYDNDNDNDNDDNENNENDNESNQSRGRANRELIHNSEEFTKEMGVRPGSSNHGKFNEVHHRNESRSAVQYKYKSNGEKVNGDNAEKSKQHKSEKTKIKSSSSSSASTSSSSSASSTRSSTESSSSSSSNSSNSESEHSTRNDHPSRKEKRKRKSKTKGKKGTESKRKRYRSRSRSTSTSKYSHSDKYNASRNRTSESSDRRRSSPHRRGSLSYRKRSPSNHKESREMSRSKYRESLSRHRDSNSKRRRRSSSTESRQTKYARR